MQLNYPLYPFLAGALITVNVLKLNIVVWCFNEVMPRKDEEEMVHTSDPDQTASVLGLLCLFRPINPNFRFFTNQL